MGLSEPEFNEQQREEAAEGWYNCAHDETPLISWALLDPDDKEMWYRVADGVAEIRKDIWNASKAHSSDFVMMRVEQFMEVAEKPFEHEAIKKMAKARAEEFYGMAQALRNQKVE